MVFKNGIVFCCVLLWTLCLSALYGEVEIPIYKGVHRAYQVALVDQSSASGGGALAQTIKKDFNFTGSFNFQTLASSKLDIPAWQKQKPVLDYVMVLKIEPSDAGHYTVNGRLIAVASGQTLWQKKFTDIPESDFKALGHQIGDGWYLNITGKKGYFQTHLALVRRKMDAYNNWSYELLISNYDGSNSQVVLSQAEPIITPTFSPDGRSISYVSYEKSQMKVYQMDLASAQRHVLADFRGINSAPSYAPNGKSMVMALTKGAGDQTNLYQLNMQYGNLIPLTQQGTNTSASFAPDGKSVAFVSDREGNLQVYSYDFATKSVHKLSVAGKQNFDPHYVEDGQKIALLHQKGYGDGIALALLDLYSGAIEPLSKSRLDKSLAVAPNGQMIAYVTDYKNAGGHLAFVAIDGTMHKTLSTQLGAVLAVAWSGFLT